MRSHRCCFTGHREIPLLERHAVIKATAQAIESLIARGVTTFMAGGALGFDILAAELVLEARKRHPDEVHLILALPCEEQTRGWNSFDIAKYNTLREQADHVRVLSPTYYRGCMHARNRFMVDHSAVCICYLRRESGGTAYTTNYAAKNGLEIIRV